MRKTGNLYQLLLTWAKDSESVADWLKQGRLLAHDHINKVLRKVLARMKSAKPLLFSIIADEAADLVYQEQLNLSIQYVDNGNEVHEDSVGLLQMSATDAATIATVIKDILVRTSLPLSPCRGQAYDGVAVTQGKQTGVATRLK